MPASDLIRPQFKELRGGDDAASDLFRSEREQQAELQRRAEADHISAVPGLQYVIFSAHYVLCMPVIRAFPALQYWSFLFSARCGCLLSVDLSLSVSDIPFHHFFFACALLHFVPPPFFLSPSTQRRYRGPSAQAAELQYRARDADGEDDE